MNLVSPWWYVLLPESVRVFGKAFHFDKCVGEVTVLETERIDFHNSTFKAAKRVEEKLCKAEMADSAHYVPFRSVQYSTRNEKVK